MDLDKLYLYAANNALSEATLALFLEQPLVKFEEFENLLKQDLKHIFQEFKLQYSKTVSVIKNDISYEESVSGFQMKGFENGKVRWIVHARPTITYYSISFHCLLYKGWNDYQSVLLEILNKISNLRKGIFIRALSLIYVDQFNWLEEVFPSVGLIFKKNDYLPNSVFNTKKPWRFGLEINGEQSTQPRNTLNYLDKIDVILQKIDEANYNISLIHNTVCEINEIETIEKLLTQDHLTKYLDFAHENNKKVIKSILKDEVLVKMGINVSSNAT